MSADIDISSSTSSNGDDWRRGRRAFRSVRTRWTAVSVITVTHIRSIRVGTVPLGTWSWRLSRDKGTIKIFSMTRPGQKNVPLGSLINLNILISIF